MGWEGSDDHPNDPHHERAARNALEQTRYVLRLINDVVSGTPLVVSVDLIRHLNRLAVEGIDPAAGELRTADVEIAGSPHSPPSFIDVPTLLDEFCTHVNRHTNAEDALSVASYALWRLNWIHPFADGNGRTARALCWAVFCSRIGKHLPPGQRTLTERIAAEKVKYYRCLQEADLAFRRGGRMRLQNLEGFLARLIEAQMLGWD